MGVLGYPLKMVIPFFAQAANHPLPGDLSYADGTSLIGGSHGIDGGASLYTLPDLRNRFLLGADPTFAIGHSSQYILYVINAVASGDSYIYSEIQNSLSYQIQTGDFLSYDIYLPSGTIPAANPKAALEIESISDGLRFHSPVDQNAISPDGDIRSYATDQWYNRRFSLSAMVGQKIIRWLLLNGYDSTFSNLSVRYQNLCIINSGKVVYRAWTGGDGTPPVNGTYSNSSSTYVSSNASSASAPGPDGVTGTHSRTMLQHHLPSHNHTGASNSAGLHSHTVNISSHSSHSHNPASGQPYFAIGTGGTAIGHTGTGLYKVTCLMAASGGAGSHSHTVSPGNAGSHTHTILVTIASGGSGGAVSAPFDARPRWYGLVYTLKSGLPSKRFQSVPLGTILMYFADTQNETLPAGVAYCDGTSYTAGNHDVPNAAGSTNYTLVTPDLRNRFVIGADRTLSFGGAGTTDDGPTGAPGPGKTGGLHSFSVNSTHLADHGHSASADTQWSTHNHAWTISSNTDHTHGAPTGYLISNDSTQTGQAGGGTPINEIKLDGTITTTTTNDGHSHTVDTLNAGSHSHTITIGNTGTNTTWDNRAPFIGLVYVIKYRAGSLLSVPLKTVVGMRQRTSGESIPSGWAVCDGTTLNSSQQDINGGGNYTLPDYRSFFPVGCDRTKTVGNTGGLTDSAADAPGPKGTGGAHTHTITTSEMPQHNHTATSDTQGDHNHGTGIATSSNAGHAHGSGCHTNWGITSGSVRSFNADFDPDYFILTYSSVLASATQPDHTASSDNQGTHAHGITVNNFGSGSAISQRPRSHGVVYLMKVKR